MNRLDLFLVAVLALAAVTGWHRGAMHRILAWGGLAAGVLLGALVAPIAASGASNPFTQAAVAFGALVVGGVLGGLAGRTVGGLLRGTTRGTTAGTFDSVIGAALSAAVVAFVCWFLALNLSNGPYPGLAEEIQDSETVKALDAIFPAPPDLLARARELFGRAEFPQVFAGLPPAPAGPVDAPTGAEARAAFEAAGDRTFRIVGNACERIQEGSGFLVSSNHVVTNAHVVAGMVDPTVQPQGGTSVGGSVVLFDPALDVAVIRVDDTLGDPLGLAGEEVPRGSGGGVLGYPGGKDLTGVGAAVTRTIAAQGRDIYGRHRIERRVYELQTEVVGGNSGGPFVLPDGTVAGMVFASSTTDPGLGYAITSRQMERDVARGVVRTEPVDTGPCLD